MDYKRISPGIRKIYSKTLGEHVYFVPDGLPPEKLCKLDGVAYTYSELLLLRGVSKDDLKVVHLAKKLFNAELVKPEVYWIMEGLLTKAGFTIDEANYDNVFWQLMFAQRKNTVKY